jgi:hypothetical protein
MLTDDHRFPPRVQRWRMEALGNGSQNFINIESIQKMMISKNFEALNLINYLEISENDQIM